MSRLVGAARPVAAPILGFRSGLASRRPLSGKREFNTIKNRETCACISLPERELL